jgi:hypothetical protein
LKRWAKPHPSNKKLAGATTVSQTNSHGSSSNTNSVTVSHDTNKGTSVTGTSSNKTSR